MTVSGRDDPIVSNAATVIVAERLDVTLAGGAPTSADAGTVVAAILTNAGNGDEAFAVTAALSPPGAAPARLAIDADGDGRYDPARDTILDDGRTPVLAPGQAATLFAIVPADAVGAVTIDAAAITGAGAPGTTFAGRGDGGGDAVTGTTGARATLTVALASRDSTAPTLTKSAAVAAPDGSQRAMAGAVIAYTLAARFPAATAGVRIADPIPAGTTYVAASLTLDDASLSDVADGDAGTANTAGIAVALPDQPAGAVRTIRFKVVIQ